MLANRTCAVAPGVATVRLTCEFERTIVRGTHGLWCTFSGFATRAEVRKHHGGASAAFARVEAVLPPPETDGAGTC